MSAAGSTAANSPHNEESKSLASGNHLAAAAGGDVHMSGGRGSIPKVPVREPKSLSRHASNAQTNTGSTETLNWVYINGLGEREAANVTHTDILTAMNFDKTGEFLALGDRGGRVIVFRYTDLKNSRYFDYRYHSEI